jgi:hypothetical protein
MDRRLFLTGLLGVAGTAAIATAMPRQAQALTGGPLEDLAPRSDALPPEVEAEVEKDEGTEVAWHRGRPHYRRRRRRRRRVRRRRWRRRCRWYRNRWGRRVRRCRRVPYWFWIWI